MPPLDSFRNRDPEPSNKASQPLSPVAGLPQRALHLAILSYNYHPEPTGIPAFNTMMAEWFAARGWQVTIHAGIPHYPWWKVPADYAARDYRGGKGDELIKGVKVQRVRHYVPAPPPSGLQRMRLDFSWTWRTLIRAIFTPPAERPDVVLAVAPPFLSGFLALVLRWRWRVPVIYHIQDLQVDAALDLKMLPPLAGRMLRWAERSILTRVDLVTTISRGMRRRVYTKCVPRRSIALFPNWAHTNEMVPWKLDKDGPNRFRAEWNLPEGHTAVLYSGSLGRKQGLETLIRAAALLDQRQDIHVFIAGDGSEKAELMHFADQVGAKRLRFLPLVPTEHLREFLSAADFHVVPQRRQAADLVMPSKLMNIMSLARPMVVTADAGTELARVIEGADCGLVVTPEDPQALAEGIIDLAENPGDRELIGRNGREYVKRWFDADRVLGYFAQRLRHLVVDPDAPDRPEMEEEYYVVNPSGQYWKKKAAE